MHTILRGKTREVTIGIDRPFVMIGEKINPTGRKKLAAALAEGNLDYVRQLAENQVAWGAEILDVNVGVPGIDEIAVVKQVVEMIASIVDIPICLDSANPDVLGAGLAVAPGKPLVNSVSGEEKKLQTVLPLVKDRGAAVIGLTMDDNGIPKTAEERVAVAERILERAAKLGIPTEDVIIDPLVLTVGSDSKAALVTLANSRSPPKGIRGEHQPGCKQCFIWAAGKTDRERSLPDPGHPIRRHLFHHRSDQAWADREGRRPFIGPG